MARIVGERRQQILEALARELESHPGDRVTTARLASALQVSEAALYRHFPSKARMFEDLIGFAEESVFGLFHRIRGDEIDDATCCRRMLEVLLGFAARNPGICRVLTGDVLMGEHERLRARVSQFFDRVETELRQVLARYELRPGRRLGLQPTAAASLLLAIVEGRMARFVRSGFRRSPDEAFVVQWEAAARIVFDHASRSTPTP
jgi:TetR/AcrR family transcriptional regulator